MPGKMPGKIQPLALAGAEQFTLSRQGVSGLPLPSPGEGNGVKGQRSLWVGRATPCPQLLLAPSKVVLITTIDTIVLIALDGWDILEPLRQVRSRKKGFQKWQKR